MKKEIFELHIGLMPGGPLYDIVDDMLSVQPLMSAWMDDDQFTDLPFLFFTYSDISNITEVE